MKYFKHHPFRLAITLFATFWLGWLCGGKVPHKEVLFTNHLDRVKEVSAREILDRASPPDLPSSLNFEAKIYLMRDFLRNLTDDEAMQWISDCSDEGMKEVAIAAMAIEHPEASKGFWESASPGLRQAMLKGWAQSIPAEMRERVSHSKADPLEQMLVLPILLQVDLGETVDAFKKLKRNIPYGALQKWAEYNPDGVASQMGKGENASLHVRTLWGAVSGQTAERRSPWLMADMMEKWSGEELSNVVAALAPSRDVDQAFDFLSRSVALGEGWDQKTLKKIPGGLAENAIASIRRGEAFDPELIAQAGEWEVVVDRAEGSRAERLAKAAMAADPKSAANMLASTRLPESLQQALADRLALEYPEQLANFPNLDAKVGFAASLKANKLQSYLDTQPDKVSSVDDLFTSTEQWKSAGLTSEQAFTIYKENPHLIKNADGWAQAAMSDWLTNNPVVASSAVDLMPPGPQRDICVTSIIEYCLDGGDSTSARLWFSKISQPAQSKVAEQFPTLSNK